ncbi:MAG: alpha/beta hydrolase [Lactovum sp.]
MEKIKVNLWEKEEYSYPMSFGFIPNIMIYCHSDTKARPFVIVVPGGGYCVVSPTESEIVALDFYERGYDVAVLTYTTNLLMRVPLKMQAMNDLARAIFYLKENYSQEIILCGFSAGGHLCGSLAVHHALFKDKEEKYSAKVSAVILAYPVITAGEFAHQGSFQALVGADKDEIDFYSLEKQVSAETVPTFIWHTLTDELVPVENSLKFIEQLRKYKVPFAAHIFSKGAHGLSLANERWAAGEYGEKYTMEQVYKILEAIENDEIKLPEQIKELLKEQFSDKKPEINYRRVNHEVASWMDLADEWLQNQIYQKT